MLRSLIALTTLGWCVVAAAAAERIDYGRDIRPILSENCFHCHGQDAAKRMADLRLDSFAEATKDRGGRAALAPGEPEASALYQRITSDNAAVRMPPVYSNRELSDEQIQLLERWIAQGGEYSDHWAFTPPRRPEIPDISASEWIKKPIDAFVLARLEAESIRPARAAAPRAWLRRVTLDLTGLPPSVAEQRRFEVAAAADGEAAYEAVVQRLLASPRYGERMAIDWLDVARYADTHGFNNDSSRSMWRWRDWVIDAFNRNLPYDRFLTEQLAGDLLQQPTLDQRIATGFNRNHVINSEGGIIEEEYRVEYVADRVRTLSMAWMGLSFECARCHDHKFDPISQRDYYRLFAFFNTVPEAGEAGRVANATPLIPAPTAHQQTRIRELEEHVGALERDLNAPASGSTLSQKELRQAEKKALKQQPKAAPTLVVSCDDGASRGPVGAACTASPDDPISALEGPKVKTEDASGFTLSVWIQPIDSRSDQPLISAIDYAPDPASSLHGRGVELRLVDGEIELRINKRAPAYSITVRSSGAEVEPRRWTHAAAVYEGPQGRPAMRAKAEWARLYVNGREVPTRIIYDDLQNPLPAFERPLRLGWNNERSKPHFAGLLDEAALWLEPFSASDVAKLFASQAVPYAANRVKDGKAAPQEQEWVEEFLALSADDRHRRLREMRSELYALRRASPTVMVMEEMAEPRPTFLLQRGMYDQPGETVEAGVPESLLGAWPDGAPYDRLGLARWLTQKNHPLTARVVVNRFWQQLFGLGLVKTSENFGLQGESPSHPDLLDWLAREFVDSGWDVKALMRMIVLSATYRQDSAVSQESVRRDPENRLLARGPRFRLPAEVIRDQALALAGLLDNRLGGPSVHPYQPAGLYDSVVVGADYPGTTWEESRGSDLYRRSLYTFWKRTLPHPTMTVFDAPDREFCIVRRSTTNTPLQALTLMNDPIYLEAARKMAERIVREGGETAEQRVRYLFELATGRAATTDEAALLLESFGALRSSYDGDKAAAKALLSIGASPADAAVSETELAAYTALASMALNLDETVTKG